jgi:hypothetical protein
MPAKITILGLALAATFLGATASRAQQVYKLCMQTDNSPPCGQVDVAMGYNEFIADYGTDIGTLAQQDRIGKKFCTFKDGGANPDLHKYNVVYASIPGGTGGTGKWIVTCQPK